MGEFLLFLSKLLPLALYPLGLTSLLLIFAIANFWSRPRRAAVALVLALTVLIISASNLMAEALLYSLERQNPPLVNPPRASAIVVLGGSTYPPTPPRQGPEVNEAGDRILYAARLYREGRAPKVILSGGRIAWKGGGQAEAIDMQTLMATMGVPTEAVILEPDSLNTYENARNVRELLQRSGIRGKLLLVTSASHMPRAKAIFLKQGMTVIPAPTDFLVETQRPKKQFQEQLLDLLPDSLALDRTTRALKEYVGWAIYRLRGWL
ncbi:YdcF family protein [Lyngbya confervoides]|uniref:YdcF family protein n=1 Tax=Lyngbya confervoides BDU141951 TaxID=1574623 RepID=A0ABD4T473_9CYAN|nr:YdcF family protein [Lyngbya confervoides]MCM1983616.1 YdcF family protein [Lyngbya confervoides BDU141951]